MSAHKQTLPVFRADRFELVGRKSMMEQVIPNHHNRMPTVEQKDETLWAVEGLLLPGQEETRRLLAINIGDVEIPDPTPDNPENTKTFFGEDVAGMLASARLGRLAAEFPHIDKLDGNEVRILLPREAKQSAYAEGLEKMHATFAAIGGLAGNGTGVQSEPIPLAA